MSVQVHLQTQQVASKGVVGMTVQVVRVQGVLALYNGLTASLGRQVLCGTVLVIRQRFNGNCG